MPFQKVLENQKAINQNPFSPMLLANNLFVLSLGFDDTLKNKNPSKWKFIDHLEIFSSQAELSLDNAKLVRINIEVQKYFPATLKALLTGIFNFSDNATPTPKECNLKITTDLEKWGP